MCTIRALCKKDKEVVIDMMKTFYSSDAVATNGSEEIFLRDFENCINDSPYLEGYIFENKNDILGYGMIAKSFSTEYGKECIWIEDIYIKKEYRRMGIGSKFLGFISDKYKKCILRLEVEKENENAIKVYKKHGFEFMPYDEMKK